MKVGISIASVPKGCDLPRGMRHVRSAVHRGRVFLRGNIHQDMALLIGSELQLVNPGEELADSTKCFHLITNTAFVPRRLLSPKYYGIRGIALSSPENGISGVKVSDETLAWQEILDIKPGGNYLEQPHTLLHCRDALQTKLFRSQPKDDWIAEGRKDLYARALDEYKNLKKHLKPVELAPEAKKELENIVKHADKELASR